MEIFNVQHKLTMSPKHITIHLTCMINLNYNFPKIYCITYNLMPKI